MQVTITASNQISNSRFQTELINIQGGKYRGYIEINVYANESRLLPPPSSLPFRIDGSTIPDCSKFPLISFNRIYREIRAKLSFSKKFRKVFVLSLSFKGRTLVESIVFRPDFCSTFFSRQTITNCVGHGAVNGDLSSRSIDRKA